MGCLLKIQYQIEKPCRATKQIQLAECMGNRLVPNTIRALGGGGCPRALIVLGTLCISHTPLRGMVYLLHKPFSGE